MSNHTIHFEVTFSRTDRRTAFAAHYAEVYGPFTVHGRKVTWTATLDPDERAAEFGTTPARELAWAIDAYAENAGYFDPSARLAYAIDDEPMSTPRRCPRSY